MVVLLAFPIVVELHASQNIIVLQLLHVLHYSPEVVHVLLLHVPYLHRRHLLRDLVHTLPNNSIGPFSQLLQDLILLLKGILQVEAAL